MARQMTHVANTEGVFSRYKGVLRLAREGGAARLTTERLDPLGLAMLAIAHQSMKGRVCDAEVRTLLVGTGEAVTGYPLRGSPPAFYLETKYVRAEVLAHYPTREWR